MKIIFRHTRCPHGSLNLFVGTRSEQILMVSLWVGRVGGASPGGHSPGANPNPDGFKKAADGAAHRSAQAAPGASPKVCIRECLSASACITTSMCVCMQSIWIFNARSFKTSLSCCFYRATGRQKPRCSWRQESWSARRQESATTRSWT